MVCRLLISQDTGLDLDDDPTTLPSCGLCTVLPARRLRACDHTHTPDVRIKLFTLKKGACMVAVCATEYFEPLMRVLCARFGCIDLRPYLILLLMDSYGDLKISNTRWPAQCTSSSANQRARE